MKKLDYIDSLRALAIISVIIVHANEYGSSDLPGVVTKFVNNGARGVQLFYLASAFTLFLSFKSRLLKEKLPIRNFFIRRFFRIAPMYYLGVCYYLFQDGFGERYWLGDEKYISVLNIISNITFTHGFNPYWINSLVPGGWSIAVEMTFYLMLPFLFSKIKKLSHAFNFFILSQLTNYLLSIVLIQFPLISDNQLWKDYLFLYFSSQLPVFALGIILYFIVIENESIKTISAKSIFTAGLILISAVCKGDQLIIPGHIFIAIGFLFLGYALSFAKWSLITNPPMNYIGKISFSMYLVHFAVLYWLTRLGLIDYWANGLLNYLTRLLIVLAFTVFISSILYRLIEIPFQNLGKKIIAKWEPASV